MGVLSYKLTISILFAVFIVSQLKLKIGMSEEELKGIYPDLNRSSVDNVIVYSRKESLYDLPVDWSYRFEKQKLSRFGWTKYFQDHDLTRVNFEKCLSVSTQAIDDLTKRYGSPVAIEKGDTTFVDPYVKHHWGYEVIKAKWVDVDGMNINVRFKFFGSKGVYFLLLETSYTDRNSVD